VAEFKQRLVRAKKQVMALKKQAADAADERDAARAELAALRDAQPAGTHLDIALRLCIPKIAYMTHASAQGMTFIRQGVSALAYRDMFSGQRAVSLRFLRCVSHD